MVWSGTLQARRKITLLLPESCLLEAIGRSVLVLVGVGTGPWPNPVRVISLIDLLVDADVQGVLFRPAEDLIRRVVVFLGCEWP